MNESKHRGGFYGKDYIIALQEHYPEFIAGDARATVDRKLRIGFVDYWCKSFGAIGVDAEDRFQPLSRRPWTSHGNAWKLSGGSDDVRKAGAYRSYKGLIRLKPATDLVLYSNLIWELQPKTIIELGSLQGGSALWFSDQLDALCGEGEVHSFDLCTKCIHPRASHPRLHFHQADLNQPESLDAQLLASLPHPWLVVDDAHVNWQNVLSFIAGFMHVNDYYILEDMFMFATAETVSQAIELCQAASLVVDSKYTDGFGLNQTCSVNGWLVKRAAERSSEEGAGPAQRSGDTR